MSFTIALIFWLLVGQLFVWLPGYLCRLSDRSYFRRQYQQDRAKLDREFDKFHHEFKWVTNPDKPGSNMLIRKNK